MADPTGADVSQATVADFDTASRTGSILLSDRTFAVFDADVFDRSGLRLLRSGQRVAVRLGRERTVDALGLPTLPLPED
jgi:2-phospho-L-lactate guanylyltransferase